MPAGRRGVAAPAVCQHGVTTVFSLPAVRRGCQQPGGAPARRMFGFGGWLRAGAARAALSGACDRSSLRMASAACAAAYVLPPRPPCFLPRRRLVQHCSEYASRQACCLRGAIEYASTQRRPGRKISAAGGCRGPAAAGLLCQTLSCLRRGSFVGFFILTCRLHQLARCAERGVPRGSIVTTAVCLVRACSFWGGGR